MIRVTNQINTQRHKNREEQCIKLQLPRALALFSIPPRTSPELSWTDSKQQINLWNNRVAAETCQVDMVLAVLRTLIISALKCPST